MRAIAGFDWSKNSWLKTRAVIRPYIAKSKYSSALPTLEESVARRRFAWYSRSASAATASGGVVGLGVELMGHLLRWLREGPTGPGGVLRRGQPAGRRNGLVSWAATPRAARPRRSRVCSSASAAGSATPRARGGSVGRQGSSGTATPQIPSSPR